MNRIDPMRQTLINADRLLTGGLGLRWYRDWSAPRFLGKILADCNFSTFSVHHPPRTFSSFAMLCDRYGSDKGTRFAGPHPYGHPPHSYADFYSSLFDHCRLSMRKVFECGLGTNNPAIPSNMSATGRPGASLRAWRDYFPHAAIYGADIDKEILFTEDRIKTFHVDQTCPESIAALWRTPELNEFDVIIDDGLHTFEAGITFFEHSHRRLRPGGIYVIEDVTLPTLQQLSEYFMKTAWHASAVTFSAKQAGGPDSSLFVVRSASEAT